MARILVADDNSNIQKMVALALQDQGVEVIGVGNGEAAVRKVPEIRPDVILADVFMPVRSGYEVCEFVKNDARFSHTPVVLLVGAFDPLDEQEAQRVHADGVLKKPFVPPEPLINLVKALLVKSAGEKLVPVAVPAASSVALAESGRGASEPEAHESEFSTAPEEELQVPQASLNVAEYEKPVAFGSLLETAEEELPALDQNDPILTAPRDPNLGEPAFWTRPPQTQQGETPPADEDDATEHSWGRSESLPGMDESAVLEPEEPIELDREAARVRALEVPPAEDEPAPAELPELPAAALGTLRDESEESALTFETHENAPVAAEMELPPTATVIEWPRTEEALPLPAPTPKTPAASLEIPPVAAAGIAAELEAPIGSEPPAVWAATDPSLESTTAQAAERQALWQTAPEVTSELTPETEPTEHQVLPSAPEPEHEEVASSWPPSFHPVTSPPESVGPAVTPATPAKWSSLEEPLPNIFAAPVPAPRALRPPEPEPPVAIPSATVSIKPATAEPVKAATAETGTAASLSPEMIDTVVNRIVDRLQPQVLEMITRDILRPVVEALVRREIGKK